MNLATVVDLENPPLTEVVCGVRFQPLEKFATPHIGLLWQKYQPEYSYYKEQAFIPAAGDLPVRIVSTPLPPRVWFTNENESLIIQVQKDRFLTNWKKVSDGQDYPHFPKVLDHFKSNFTKFTDFLNEGQLGFPDLLEYELTYVNIIPKGQGWQDCSDLSSLFPSIGWNWSKQRGLLNPKGINLNTVCLLPDNVGLLQLNLVSIKKIQNDEEALQLSLSVRKVESSSINSDAFEWFGTARKWIVNGFLSLTNPEVQKECWKICPEQPKKKQQKL